MPVNERESARARKLNGHKNDEVIAEVVKAKYNKEEGTAMVPSE